MKKYLLGVCAVLLAVVAFSFTNAKKVDCTDQLYWFKVDPTFNTTLCSTAASHLLVVTDVNNNNLPDEIQFAFKSSLPYGCQDTQTNICAVGYASYTIDAVTKEIRPSGAVICCIKRPLVP